MVAHGRRAGDAEAQSSLGIAYANGEGVEQDPREAAKWHRAAAEQGHARAQYNLGVAFDEGRGVDPDKEKAAEWYRAAADNGHRMAQNNLGVAYWTGLGVRYDLREAARWWRRAGEQGLALAQYNLGALHWQGENENKSQSFIWFSLAKERGHRKAVRRMRDTDWREFLSEEELQSAQKELARLSAEIARREKEYGGA